jgi:Icc-related predicted phosphoesterase
MRILFIGDIHGEINALGRALRWASTLDPFDVVVLSGDLCAPISGKKKFKFARRLYHVSAQAVLQTVACMDLPVMFIPGNHDVADLSSAQGLKNVWNIDLLTSREMFVQAGFTFVGIGGSSHYKGKTPYEWDEEETGHIIQGRLDALKLDPTATVLLAHDPPWSTLLDVTAKKRAGSHTIRDIVTRLQPRLLLSGHLHESSAVDIIGNTPGINAGSLTFSEQAVTNIPEREFTFTSKSFLHFFSVDIKKKSTEIVHFVSYEDGEEPMAITYRVQGSRLQGKREGEWVDKPTTGASQLTDDESNR